MTDTLICCRHILTPSANMSIQRDRSETNLSVLLDKLSTYLHRVTVKLTDYTAFIPFLFSFKKKKNKQTNYLMQLSKPILHIGTVRTQPRNSDLRYCRSTSNIDHAISDQMLVLHHMVCKRKARLSLSQRLFMRRTWRARMLGKHRRAMSNSHVTYAETRIIWILSNRWKALQNNNNNNKGKGIVSPKLTFEQTLLLLFTDKIEDWFSREIICTATKPI